MQKLTDKEEEIMNLFWSRGPMYVRQILDCMPEPKPHFNTISTFVRILEGKGFVGHERTGNSFRYKPLIGRGEYSRMSLRNVIDRYFGSSLRNVVSALVSDTSISADELEELRRIVNESSVNESSDKANHTV